MPNPILITYMCAIFRGPNQASLPTTSNVINVPERGLKYCGYKQPFIQDESYRILCKTYAYKVASRGGAWILFPRLMSSFLRLAVARRKAVRQDVLHTCVEKGHHFEEMQTYFLP
jgi:hypothetical protein